MIKQNGKEYVEPNSNHWLSSAENLFTAQASPRYFSLFLMPLKVCFGLV